MADSIEVEGIIRKNGTEIAVEINSDSFERVGAFRDDLEDGQPVRLILWDARPPTERSNIEQVSKVQQLPKDVVALGLRTRGAIQNKDFLEKLLSP